MTKQQNFSSLKNKIACLENKVADTRYFIETAPCLETKKIYQGTLTELIKELEDLSQLLNQQGTTYRPA